MVIRSCAFGLLASDLVLRASSGGVLVKSLSPALNSISVFDFDRSSSCVLCDFSQGPAEFREHSHAMFFLRLSQDQVFNVHFKE